MDKMNDNELRLFGHIMKREKLETVMVMEMNIKGSRERPKKRWLNVI